MTTAAARQVSLFIEALPQPQRQIAERLRELLFEQVPGIEEKFSFKLPFYHYYGMFCYLHFDKHGLHLCFCRGKDLVAAFPQLAQKARAAIASVTLHILADISKQEVPQLIITAAAWNKEAKEKGISPVVRKKSK